MLLLGASGRDLGSEDIVVVIVVVVVVAAVSPLPGVTPVVIPSSSEECRSEVLLLQQFADEVVHELVGIGGGQYAVGAGGGRRRRHLGTATAERGPGSRGRPLPGMVIAVVVLLPEQVVVVGLVGVLLAPFGLGPAQHGRPKGAGSDGHAAGAGGGRGECSGMDGIEDSSHLL